MNDVAGGAPEIVSHRKINDSGTEGEGVWATHVTLAGGSDDAPVESTGVPVEPTGKDKDELPVFSSDLSHGTESVVVLRANATDFKAEGCSVGGNMDDSDDSAWTTVTDDTTDDASAAFSDVNVGLTVVGHWRQFRVYCCRCVAYFPLMEGGRALMIVLFYFLYVTLRYNKQILRYNFELVVFVE